MSIYVEGLFLKRIVKFRHENKSKRIAEILKTTQLEIQIVFFLKVWLELM